MLITGWKNSTGIQHPALNEYLWVWAHCACWCSTIQCTSVCLW